MPIISIAAHRILFIHVPKTGGSAIEKHFAEHGTVSFERIEDRSAGLRCIPRHWHASLLESAFSPSMFDYAFMVVRHPVERIVSDYRFYVKRKRREHRPPNFSRWLRYRLWRARMNPYYMDNHFRPQNEFVYRGAHVFRYEEGLDRCVAAVTAALNLDLPATLPRVNVSPDVPVNLSEADIKLIQRRYAEDFHSFGYLAGGASLPSDREIEHSTASDR